jgi:hypothetical protein
MITIRYNLGILIAQSTDVGEQRVREIANGKRRIENYDVYAALP